MANYASLYAAIATNIYENHLNKVTANMVKAACDSIVNSLGYGYQFRGAVTPSSTGPGAIDQRVFYIASTPGTYTDFGGFVLGSNEVALLKWDTIWSKETLDIPSKTQIMARLASQDADIAALDAEVISFEDAVRYMVENYPNITINGDVTNAPDGEDLKSVNVGGTDVLKFANRPAVDGMGYIILRKGSSFASQVTEKNTIYEIRYDFVLSEDVTIPDNCVLRFNGGSIRGSQTIFGTNTRIDAAITNIFDEDIILDGTWKTDGLFVEWFGAKGDYDWSAHDGTDDYLAFTSAIKNANIANINKVKLASSAYLVNHPIEITSGNILIEGVYVKERESDFWSGANDIKEANTSALVTTEQNNVIFKIVGDTTHPIHLKYVCFYSYQHYESRAIQIASTFWGPLWPIYLENCRFVGFDKAVYVGFDTYPDDYLEYSLSQLDVDNCVFWNCKFCVYFDERNYARSFRFSGNQCGGNEYIMKVRAGDNIVILGNNMEGDNGELLAPEADALCEIIMHLDSEANLIFHRNYFENNTLNIAKIRQTTAGYLPYNYICNIDIGNNILRDSVVNKKVVMDGYFTIKQSDIDIYAVGMIFTEKFDNIYVDKGELSVLYNDFGVEETDKYSFANQYKQGSVSYFPTQKMIDGGLCGSYGSAIRLDTQALVNNQNSYVVIQADFSNEKETNKSALRVPVNAGDNAYLRRFRGYKYGVVLHYVGSGAWTASNLDLYIVASSAFIECYAFGQITSDNAINAKKAITKLGYKNIIDADKLPGLTGMKTGDKLFISDTKKIITYYVSHWYYADGTQA